MIAAPQRVNAAVADLRRNCHLPVNSDCRGPVMLDRFFEETNLAHAALPQLTRLAVADYLRADGVPVEDLGDPAEKLAGFVFLAGHVGWAFVNGGEPLVRRRFTAAHELGHFVLHGETMGRCQADAETPDKKLEEADADQSKIMEQEANRFAAELLMPAEVCEMRAEQMAREHGRCPRGVLAYRLAGELLVSTQAMTYRLKTLRLGDD